MSMSKAFLVVAFAGVCSAATFNVGLPFTDTTVEKIVAGLPMLKETADNAVSGTSTCTDLVEQTEEDSKWEITKKFDCEGAEVNVTESAATERSAVALAERHMVNMDVGSDLTETEVLAALKDAATELDAAAQGGGMRYVVNLAIESELSEEEVLDALKGFADDMATAVGGKLDADTITNSTKPIERSSSPGNPPVRGGKNPYSNSSSPHNSTKPNNRTRPNPSVAGGKNRPGTISPTTTTGVGNKSICSRAVPVGVVDRFNLYRPSDMIRCFESIPLNKKVKESILDAVLELTWLWPGTDMAASTESDPRVNLVNEIKAIREANQTNDWEFHSSVAGLFTKLKDGHTMYSIPDGFKADYVSMIEMVSRLDEHGVQQMYVEEMFPWIDDALWNERIPQGSLVKTIEGKDAVQYVADQAFERSVEKTVGQAFNSYLLDSALEYINTPGNYKFDIEERPGRRRTRHGIPVPDSEKMVLVLPDGTEVTANVPVYAFLPNSRLDYDFIMKKNRGQRDAYEGEPVARRGAGRGATVLSPLDLFGTEVGMKRLWEYPTNRPDHLAPEIYCGSLDNIRFLHIGTFFPDTLEGECPAYEGMLGSLRTIAKCIDGAEELIMDVRGNGGGYVIYQQMVLHLLFPKYFPVVDSIDGNAVQAQVTPAAAASRMGLYEFSLSPDMPEELYNSYARMESTDGYFDAATGREMQAEEVFNAFKDAKTESRVPSAPKRRVTKRMANLQRNMLGKEYLAAISEDCEDEKARGVFDEIPIKSVLKKVSIVSLGACASACSRFVETLVQSGFATTLTMGGVKGKDMEASAFSNGPVVEWDDLVDNVVASDGVVGEQLLTPLSSSATIRLSICSWYASVDEKVSPEYAINTPSNHLWIWPPYTPAQEREIFNQAVKQLADVQPPAYEPAKVILHSANAKVMPLQPSGTVNPTNRSARAKVMPPPRPSGTANSTNGTVPAGAASNCDGDSKDTVRLIVVGLACAVAGVVIGVAATRFYASRSAAPTVSHTTVNENPVAYDPDHELHEKLVAE